MPPELPNEERMDDFVRLLTDLGGLHDATVTKFILDVTERSFSFEVDDVYSNFEGLPDYRGPKPARVVLKKISSVEVNLGLEVDKFNIYDFSVHQTNDGRWNASIKLWPEGKISVSFLDVDYPHELRSNGCQS